MHDALLTISDMLSARVAGAGAGLVSVHPGSRAQRTATLWRPGVLVTSEQGLPPEAAVPIILAGGMRARAQLAGRDPGTNVAVLRFDLDGPVAPEAGEPQVGALALMLGAATDGSPTARLAMVHRVGPAWESAGGGRIDQLISLDARLSGRDEGGPILDAAGGLLGMSTLGPRRRVLVIPAVTVNRVLAPLLADGQVTRGWLGLGLQPVSIPALWQPAAGLDSGLMVISLTPDGPAEEAGVLPGDILMEVDGAAAPNTRAVARALNGNSV
ncbi:MAG: serine protease, partial [Gemmatimonadaceae bacterium]|nr:serine protease [Acetobacteraceae bacterium]